MELSLDSVMPGLLDGYRVIDLADEKGIFCGCILADMGAEVIKVEKPGGDPVRKVGPFYNDIPDPQKSLFWFANNEGKLGITLNIESPKGREILKRLVTSADIVVESFQPGYLDSIGLGYQALSRVNPKVIMVSLTPFGQTGPYSSYKASDMCCIAMGGIMYDSGDPDRPPIRISVDQAYLFGGMHGAMGALFALRSLRKTSKGQHLDVAIRDAILRVQQQGLPSWEHLKIMHIRKGRMRKFGSVYVRDVWECKDGCVGYRLLAGPAGTKQINQMLEWMRKENIPGTDEAAEIVQTYGSIDPSRMTQNDIDVIEESIARLFQRHTMAELYAEACKLSFPMGSANTMQEVFSDEQLRSRNFWVDIEHPELGTKLTYPGHIWLSSETYSGVRRRAPLIGEHNEQIYSKLGFGADDIAELKKEGVI